MQEKYHTASNSLAPRFISARIGPKEDLFPTPLLSHGPKTGEKLSNVKLTLALILSGLIVLFTLQNAEIVELRLLLWKLSMPRALMIFSLLVVGIILGWILSELKRHKRW